MAGVPARGAGSEAGVSETAGVTTRATTEPAAAGRRPKRGHGEGAVFYDDQKALWVASVMVGRCPDGRPDRRKVKAKTKRECLAKLLRVRQEHAAGELADPNRVTVEVFLTAWLEETVRLRRRASTYRQYKSLLTAHLFPSLGQKPLKAVQTKHLDELYRALEREGRRPVYGRKGRPRTRRPGWRPSRSGACTSPSTAGSSAPSATASSPATPPPARSCPRAPRGGSCPSAWRTCRSCWRRPPPRGRGAAGAPPGGSAAQWAALWTFLANTGLRIGEALGLRWADVDLASGWFRVARDLDRGLHGAVLGDTKTAAGSRHVPLTASALAALQAHRSQQDELREVLQQAYRDHGLVFAASTGAPLSARNALRAFKAAARAGLPAALCPHDLRRMTASLLVAGGVDVATAAADPGPQERQRLARRVRPGAPRAEGPAARTLEGALYGDAAG